MRLLRDWKWNAALAVFALFTALVVWLPGPQANSTDAINATPPTVSPTEPTTIRPEPTPADQDAMLRYRVQEGDTVAGIAHLFVVSEQDLRWANRIPEGGELPVGELIWIPVP